MKKMKILIAVFLVMMIAASTVLMTSCSDDSSSGNNNSDNSDNSSNENDNNNYPVLGAGAKSFIAEITVADGTVKTYTVKTDDETIGDALMSAKLIPDDSKTNGFFTNLDGVTAEYAVDQSYWAIYIGDEYAMTGAFEMEVANGTVYKFIYTKDEPFDEAVG